jgi:4-hydroxy-tetrahydrodipicolinate synthase
MKYRKNEAKEYARGKLKGVWTALPTAFTDDDRLDDAGNQFNLEHCISKLKIEGHYMLGNVAEFWAMTNEERMRVHEVNADTAKGRIPLIAGCHHQNPYEVVKLCNHAESVGVDFAIILTPYQAAMSDDAVFDFYDFIASRVNIGIVLFNIPQAYYPIGEKLAKRLAALPNICGFKQANPGPAATISLRREVGKDVVVSVADENSWFHNLSVFGDRWLLNFCPHLYQVPGHLPIHDYTEAALAGDMNKAVAISRTVIPYREVHAKWITGYGRSHGRMPVHEQKVWMEALGMVGGRVRAPCSPMTEENRRQLLADMEASGLLAKYREGQEPTKLRKAG